MEANEQGELPMYLPTIGNLYRSTYSSCKTFHNCRKILSSMALKILKHALFVVLLTLMTSHAVFAGDPNIISDFVLPPNTTIVGANYFTYTRLRSLFDADIPEAFTITKATKVEFPALGGQSVSYAVLQFPSDAVNPPHTHTRGAELLFLVEGSLQVGFVDTANKLYTQTLQPGDMFVFPRGLVHYQICGHNPAIAISAFGSANAGTVSIPATVFATGIDEDILSKSFRTDIPTIEMLKFNISRSLK